MTAVVRKVKRGIRTSPQITMPMLRALDKLAGGGDWRKLSVQVRLDLLGRGLVDRLPARRGIVAVAINTVGRRAREDMRGITERPLPPALKPGERERGLRLVDLSGHREPVAVASQSGIQVAQYGDDRGPAHATQHRRAKQDQALVGEGRSVRLVRVRRAVDTLEELSASGEITEAMLRVGREFQRNFAVAGLDPLRAINWDRIGGASPKVESDAILQARRNVDRMIERVGGGRSAPAQALYWVVGAGLAYADFARRISWAGRVMDQRVVKGLVVAALSVLAPRRGASAGDEMARPECWIILHRYETGFASLAESLAAADRLPDEEARTAVRRALNSAVSGGSENTA